MEDETPETPGTTADTAGVPGDSADASIPAQPVDPIVAMQAQFAEMQAQLVKLTEGLGQKEKAPDADPDDLTAEELEEYKRQDPLGFKAYMANRKLAEHNKRTADEIATNAALQEWNSAISAYPTERHKDIQKQAIILERGYIACGEKVPPFKDIAAQAAKIVSVEPRASGSEVRSARATSAAKSALVPNSGAKASMSIDEKIYQNIEKNTGKKISR